MDFEKRYNFNNSRNGKKIGRRQHPYNAKKHRRRYETHRRSDYGFNNGFYGNVNNDVNIGVFGGNNNTINDIFKGVDLDKCLMGVQSILAQEKAKSLKAKGPFANLHVRNSAAFFLYKASMAAEFLT